MDDVEFQTTLLMRLRGAPPTPKDVARAYTDARCCIGHARAAFRWADGDPAQTSAYLGLAITWLTLAVRDREVARRLRRAMRDAGGQP